MAEPTKLTDKIVVGLTVPVSGNQRAFDTELTGFCCVVTATGVRSFALRYRLDGKQRMGVIGRFPTWTTSAARTKARTWRRMVDDGVDPLAEEPAAQPGDTVASVIELFIARDQKPRNRTWREVEQILRRELKPWLDRDIQSITRRDVLDRLDTISDRAPIRARRVHAWTGRMFRWAVGRGIVEASPIAGVESPGRENARDRVLAPEELPAVWQASEALQPPFRQIVQLLAVTAARKGEVVKMRWQDLDLERRLWTVPKEMNKAGRVHEVPLSDLAIEILGTLPRNGDGLVFPAQRVSSINPVSGFGNIKTRLDQLSGVTDWRLHDLRRTAASGMARLGHPPHVVAAVLNHAPASTMGITAVYNRFRYSDEKRAALDAWSREIERLLGRGEATVVHFPKTS